MISRQQLFGLALLVSSALATAAIVLMLKLSVESILETAATLLVLAAAGYLGFEMLSEQEQER